MSLSSFKIIIFKKLASIGYRLSRRSKTLRVCDIIPSPICDVNHLLLTIFPSTFSPNLYVQFLNPPCQILFVIYIVDQYIITTSWGSLLKYLQEGNFPECYFTTVFVSYTQEKDTYVTKDQRAPETGHHLQEASVILLYQNHCFIYNV